MKVATLLAAAFFAASTGAVSDTDVKIVLAAAPKSNTCDGAPEAGQCATAQDAAPKIIAALETYKMTTPGEQAGLLAWMAFESGDFKYNIAKFNNPPAGKGSRCMMSPDFNAEYAKTVGDNEADPGAMLKKLIADGHEWDACAWYYSAKCDDTVKKGAQAGTLAGHLAFLKDCVNTEVTDARKTYWTNTAKAFGLSGE